MLLTFDESHRKQLKEIMKIQEKFIMAIEKYLAENKIKNIYQLSLAAGVDQAGLSSFFNTHQYHAGKGKKPARIKNDIYLDSAGKIIEYIGGELIFPWDKESNADYMEIKRLKDEVEKLNAKINNLEKDLFGCQQVRDSYKDLLSQQLRGYQTPPDMEEKKQNCA